MRCSGLRISKVLQLREAADGQRRPEAGGERVVVRDGNVGESAELIGLRCAQSSQLIMFLCLCALSVL